MNKVLLVGRIASYIKLGKMQNGASSIKTSIAVKKPNNPNNDAEFIDIIAKENIADFIAKNVSKGTLVSLEGYLSLYRFKNKAGMPVKLTYVNVQEITVLSKSNKNIAENSKLDSAHVTLDKDIPTAESIIED
ncbi:Single-stranded DNA-binding protein [Mycoplasmopsis agalactiae 14628]|uniref:Single-stranded DNA-binding protein n=1 Tax=Mycoplasmopsis agalactiae 14628 TaxID=1110504 RepID=I5D5X0_MYCAA|nr:single-stranded DNA-binding protein [Mycoplasmopsis agalactiae]EIN15079.1 Single-stranded DNA-binding protein [Mycoplasmopsis agalactiae 14628]